MIARRLLGSYPSTNLHDPEMYIAELVTIICRYPRAAVERGIAAARRKSPEFLPTCSRILEAVEGVEADDQRHADVLARYSTKRLTSDSHAMPPVQNHATRSALCGRFGLKDIPTGWDAITVTQLAAVHGANFPAVVDGVLAEQAKSGGSGSKSAFGRVVEQAKQAMEARWSAESLAASDSLKRVMAEKYAAAGKEPE